MTTKSAMSDRACHQCQYYQRKQTGPNEWGADCSLKQACFLDADSCGLFLPGRLLDENNDWPMNRLIGAQPAPTESAGPAIWDLVIADMRARDQVGTARYGTRLRPHNGRDALIDAYQEALDLCCYLRQAIYERDEGETK